MLSSHGADLDDLFLSVLLMLPGVIGDKSKGTRSPSSGGGITSVTQDGRVEYEVFLAVRSLKKIEAVVSSKEGSRRS